MNLGLVWRWRRRGSFTVQSKYQISLLTWVSVKNVECLFLEKIYQCWYYAPFIFMNLAPGLWSHVSSDQGKRIRGWAATLFFDPGRLDRVRIGNDFYQFPGLKDTQKDLIENLIHSKRLNHSVCQANRHLSCRVYVPMHVSTCTWKRVCTNLFTCRALSWMGTAAALLRTPPSPLPATKSWENHRDLAKNLKSRSPALCFCFCRLCEFA